ncbi:wax ester/triacylglycerol synthase family O-acyltransferase [Gordonia sp. NPDC003424]
MQQLTGLDQMFFSLDSQTTNAVLGGLVRFEPLADGQTGPDEAFMRKRLAERLPFIPPMTKVVRNVPLGLDYGYLADPGRIDLDDHLRTIELPAPGDEQALAEEVSRIMGYPLRDDRPLWDLWIIKGLADGSIAMLLRIHHGMVDGSTMPRIWDLFSDEPTEPMEADTTGKAPLPEPFFGDAEMAVRAVAGTLKRPLTMTRLTYRFGKWVVQRYPEDGLTTVPGLVTKVLPGAPGRVGAGAVNFFRRRRGADEIQPYLQTWFPPRTEFNSRASSSRHFVFSEMELARVKKVGKRMDATLNNTVVALCAGAVRRYLEEHGGTPDEPLCVCVPVSLRHENIEVPWANHVHMMFSDFPTQIEDPIERVRVVTTDLTKAKNSFDGLPTHLIREASNFLPKDLFSWMTKLWIRLPEKYSRAPWNIVVSNVRGPSKPATMNGVKVLGYWPASFLSIGGGLNITLQSYVDKICFGFIGAPELVGDLWPLVGYMNDALEELEAAVDAQEAGAVVELTPTPSTEGTKASAAEKVSVAR